MRRLVPALALALALVGVALGRADASPPGAGFKPKQAFLAHAAKILQVSPDQLEGGANDEAGAKLGDMNFGGAWQFVMWPKSMQGQRETRGWATADGTVVTADENLGVLFVEAGVWKKPSPKNSDELADKLAAAIAWSYGVSSAGHPGVVKILSQGLAPPRLTLKRDAGSLHFFLEQHPIGPGGAGGGPTTYYEVDVALTADHKATLTKKLFTPKS